MENLILNWYIVHEKASHSLILMFPPWSVGFISYPILHSFIV